MRSYLLMGAVAALCSAQAWSAANCLHSHSWQCQQHHSTSSQGSQTGGGISSVGHSPNPGTSNPHLGTTGGNNQNPVAVVKPPLAPVLVPPRVPPKVPPKQPIAVPSQVPQPMQVPSQVPPQVPPKVPPKQPIAVPGMVPQPIVSVPHPSHVHVTPPGGVLSVTQPVKQPTTSQPMLPGGKQPVPVLLPHRPHTVTQVPQVVTVPNKTTPVVTPSKQTTQPTHVLVPTGQSQVPHHTTGAEIWANEIVEPGIQNRTVELYRSEDAEELMYKDVIPMDKTGFHLTVIGIRPPDYGTVLQEDADAP